jgi:hypothetical protein
VVQKKWRAASLSSVRPSPPNSFSLTNFERILRKPGF